MKIFIRVWLSALMMVAVMAVMSAAQSQGDSLAEYAKAKRKEKPGSTKKVFDNDNLPQTEHISVVGQSSAQDQNSNAAASSNNTSKPAAKDEAVKSEPIPGESPEDRQKVYQDYEKKIADQKAVLDLAQRELDVSQREYRMRSAAVYADVGYRLRNSTKWDKEDAQFKQQISAKQKAVDTAKQQLATIQEQARKSGVPSKMRE